MTEDMQVRNLSPHTQTCYVQQVSLFARHFRTSPEVLGPEDIRSYQVYLTNEKKLAPGSILIAVAALRFLYRVTLHKDWSFQDIILDFFRLFKDGKRYRRLKVSSEFSAPRCSWVLTTNRTESWCSTGRDFILLTTFIFGDL
jgi:hypothetical protein